jgi:translation initiation factor 5
MALSIDPRQKDDAAYRYKMPAVVGKVEGRGNGIKTVVVNCSRIAQALERPPSHLTKFFGCELGAQSKWTLAADRAVLTGAHQTGDLQEMIFLYIEKFVLCGSCRNPETKLKVKVKSGTISRTCAACGAKSSVDMGHKLCNFILKEAKAKKKSKTDAKSGGKDGAKKSSKAQRKAERDELKKKKREKREAKELEAKRTAAMESGAHVDEDGEIWLTDFSEEAASTRKQEEMARAAARAAQDTGAMIDAALAEEAAATREEALDATRARAVATGKIRAYMAESAARSVAEIVEHITNLQLSEVLTVNDRVGLAFEGVFGTTTSAASVMGAAAQHAAVFQQLVAGAKAKQWALLCAIERHFALEPARLAIAPLVLKALYDEPVEVFTEDVFAEWVAAEGRMAFSDPSVDDDASAAFKASAKPFLDWCTAESESGSESEED